MTPVRIDDEPQTMIGRRRLDIRVWQCCCALRALHEKGLQAFTAVDVIGEIDQRKDASYTSGPMILLHLYSYRWWRCVGRQR